MPTPIAPGIEPIPGYRVISRLGSGGYGEVWKVTAPGDVPKALKVVYGGRGLHAEQEQKSLERIKAVRHPFLLSLERFEVLESQLLIVTELADKSLLDRYLECRGAGLAGIPRDELLAYLRDAADALDYMSAAHGLQHQDIKPQNLLLLAGRIKVADFGLVKELAGTRATATGGATPVYAPPEAYDGWISRHSDQYSLAIVFQEMLTGVRPFPGTTALQLARQHTSGRPLLDPLPAHDRPVIGRALAKVPDQRYPSCGALVAALLGGPTTIVPSAPTSTPAPEDESLLLKQATVVDPDIAPAPPPPTLITSGPSKRETAPNRKGDFARADRIGARPTLVVGAGGLAGAALRRLSQLRLDRPGSRALLPTFRMLLLDSDPANLRRTREAGSAATREETLLTPLYPPEHYRSRSRALLRWLDRRWLYGIPRSMLTEGLRPLGRLALIDNAASILEQLRAALTQVTAPENRAAAAKATGLPLREMTPRVFLVASIAGGTGGGMLLTLAYAIRQVLTELGLRADGTCGLLLHATSQKPAEQELARANAHATLRELAHFWRPAAAYPGDPDEGLIAPPAGTAPFSDCYLVHLGDGVGEDEVDAATARVAEYIHLDAEAGGEFFDRFRQETRPAAEAPPTPPTLRGFGLYRIGFPRQFLVTATATLLSRRLVERWVGPGDDTLRKRSVEKARSWVASLGLDEESLVRRCHEKGTEVFGENPEKYFRDALGMPAQGAPPTTEDVRQLLDKVDALLGTGPVPDVGDSGVSLTHAEAALQGRAGVLAGELARSLLDGLLEQVETPGRRLAVADAANSWLAQHVLAVADGIRSHLTTQVRAHRQALRLRLASGKGSTRGGVFSWLRIPRWKADPTRMHRDILDYCWVRLGELAVENAMEVLALIHNELFQFGQELIAARQLLTSWLQSVKPPEERTRGGVDLGASRELFPDKAVSLDEATTAVCNRLGADFLEEFDERFQTEVLLPEGGLWRQMAGALAGAPGPTMRRIWSELERRAREAVLPVLTEVNAARLFLDQYPHVDQGRKVLADHLHSATPRLQVAGGWQQLVLALPGGSAGETLKEMIDQTAAGVPVTVVPSIDDLLLCFEVVHMPIAGAAVALSNAEPTDDLRERVLTRIDISWEPLTPDATGSIGGERTD
jgi:hypothetical protein